MPVDADQFNTMKIVVFAYVKGDKGHDDHTSKDMQSVKSSGCIIEGPEHVFGDGVAVDDFAGVFIDLDHHEN